MSFDVIIIGAGAAGLMCAIEAGKRGRKVLVLERAEKTGKKILISGGGRCNFTNIHTKPENFISGNPHFCKSALARYTPADFIAMVEKHGIKYHEKKLGQLFCDNSAKEIVAMLESECAAAGAEIKINCEISEIEKNNGFTLKTNLDDFNCESLVIASGGISIPQMGATDLGYKIAKQFGIKLTKIVPGLVPFVLKNNPFADLSGVSVDSVVSCQGVSFSENILFTHKGLSGPAILQISNYWDDGDEVAVNLLPGRNIIEMITENSETNAQLVNFLSAYLPGRFAEKWCELNFSTKPVNRVNEKDLKIISENIHSMKVLPSDTEGFGKAEVTKGGVDTDELSSKTMESKSVKGLFFVGEVVDVTGWLGGYNFQWAWASGYAAGQYV